MKLAKTFILTFTLLLLFLGASAQADAPYPQSTLISSVSFDFASQQTHGQGADQWVISWADDGDVYGVWGDGNGWSGATRYFMGVTQIQGNIPNLTGIDIWGGNDKNRKPNGFIADSGRKMYLFYGTDADNWDGSYGMSSSDNGRNWTDTNTRVFSYSADSVLVVGIAQFGPGYTNLPQGIDSNYFYVYLSGRQGGKDGRGREIYLGRVPKAQIFDRAAYAYFNGLDSNNSPVWSSQWLAKQPVFIDPAGMEYHVNVTYNPALETFILAKGQNTSHLGFFEGPNLWGAWKTIYYGQFKDSLWKFTYQIPQKWMTADGKGFTLAWSGWPEYDNVNFVKANLVVLPQIPEYAAFELTLAVAGNYANPYLQMPGDSTTPGFVAGTFTGPGSTTITIDGFWDGGDTWKIRMAPTVEGVWTYTTSSADAGLNGQTGSFHAVASSNKGFLRVDPVNKHHFIWDGGTPFYWAPTAIITSFFTPIDAYGDNRRIDDGTFQSYLNTRKDQGFNVTHWGYQGFNKPQWNNRTQSNEGGSPFVSFDPNQLNTSYHQFADQRLQAQDNTGIISQLSLGWPDQGIWSSIGDTQLKRYWRYLIARYSAYNVTWLLFGEGDEFGSGWEAIVNDYGNLTKKFDPYKHLTTTHLTSGPTSTLANQSWYDYIMLQTKTTATSGYLNYNKPVINSEYCGYEDVINSWCGGTQLVTGDVLRPMIWDIRMRGGYFVYESYGNNILASGAVQSGIANKFFQDKTQFNLLEYHPELFNNTPGLANPGQEYVYYAKSGGAVTVNLSSTTNTFNTEWFNPRDGAYTSSGTTVGGTQRSFTAPDTNDWVLHLTALPQGFPYPQSSVISSITFDTSTHKSTAFGSDLWPNTWGADDNIYTSWGDGGGFGGADAGLGFALVTGAPETFTSGTNLYSRPRPGGKTAGIISINGTLYAWLNTQSANPPPHRLIWSTDSGLTWTESSWTFDSSVFTPVTFLNFGKGYQGARDNYVYSYGGSWGNNVNSYLVRVPVGNIQDKNYYEYFAGLDGSTPLWSPDINQRQPVFTDPMLASAPNGGNKLTVSYNAGIQRYLLTALHGQSGQLGIFDGPEPWGPWTTVAYYDNWINANGSGTNEEGLIYGFSNKWTSVDGLTSWMIFSCYNCNSSYHDRFNLIKATLTLTGATPTPTPTPISGLISNLVVNSPNSADYAFEQALNIGSIQYGDRSFTFSSVPGNYLNLPYLKTANDDKGTTGSNLISFDVSQDVTLYVASDDRVTPKPSWMSTFADTNDNLISGGGTFSIFSKDYSAGGIILGGNEGGSNSMYTVTVESKGVVSTPAVLEDVNNDGHVDVLDIQVCVNYILAGDNSGDVNGDGDTNVLDVQVIVNIILGA